MGSAKSTQAVVPEGVIITKRRSTATTTSIDNNDWQNTGFGSIKKRSGHPMQFKQDGYRILARLPR